MTGQQPARIGLIGAGWRAQYYLRIAQHLPEQFTVTRVLVRSASSAAQVTADWGVDASTSFDDFVRGAPFDYVVVSVPVAEAGDLILRLVMAGIPALTETPPAESLPQLSALYTRVGSAPVQVAEQYQFQPHHAARLAIARSGTIGDVSTAHVSVAHGYHGVSLIRMALGVGFEPVTISGFAVSDRVVSARGRDSWNNEYTEYDSVNTTAVLRFVGSTAVFEFNVEQYFSPIRDRNITIRGTRGEIRNDAINHLTVAGQSARERLYREVTGVDGDLEGSFLRRVSLRDTVYYENRFGPARLNDDELAVAEVMHRMAEYVSTGREFYGLADASHDQYLSLLIDESVASGRPVASVDLLWASVSSAASSSVRHG